MNPKVSLFASAVRPALWPALFKSLEGTSVGYEIIFCGNSSNLDLRHWASNWELKYIQTANIKPAQCYEIARRNCIGEVVVWIADDCEFPNDVIGKAYEYWKSKDNEKLILSIQTKESGYNLPVGQLFDMKQHCFFGNCPDSPLMAPLAMMSRKFLEEIGGFDRRFCCGQYENLAVLMAYERGAKVEIFGDPECYIDIDHIGKSLAIGESKIESDFLNRPFATEYRHDREILERLYCRFNVHKLEELIKSGKSQVHQSEVYDISPTILEPFIPYKDTDILIKSQDYKGKWE